MKKRTILEVCVLVTLVAGIVALLLIISSRQSTPTNNPSRNLPVPSQPAVAKPQPLRGSYLISGDVFWGRGIDYYAQRSPLKYDWPFSRLKEFHPEKYNGWISDMECPVTDRTVPYQVQVDSLILSCSPDYLKAASQYFSAFTLANNHTNNTGQEGFADTRKNLAKAGIQFFGHYDPAQTNDLCEVVALKVAAGQAEQRLPIAMCGYHWLYRLPTDAELAQISRYAKYFPVWVFPHGGTEYATHSSLQQQTLYRKMIDLGADVIFGDHPHVIQNTEAYKGRLIVYNFGNLIYDQWFNPEVTKSLIVNTQISADAGTSLQPYIDMAGGCLKFKDSCLAQARTKGLVAYKLKYSYKIIVGDSSNVNSFERVKHPGSSAVQAWLEKRTDWQTTLVGLK